MLKTTYVPDNRVTAGLDTRFARAGLTSAATALVSFSQLVVRLAVNVVIDLAVHIAKHCLVDKSMLFDVQLDGVPASGCKVDVALSELVEVVALVRHLASNYPAVLIHRRSTDCRRHVRHGAHRCRGQLPLAMLPRLRWLPCRQVPVLLHLDA